MAWWLRQLASTAEVTSYAPWVPHGCPSPPPPPPPIYLIPVAYFMAFDTMFHPLSFHATNIGHTKPRARILARDRCTACTKSRANPRPINCNVIP